MKILNNPGDTLIRPLNLYLYDPVAKRAFLTNFEQDIASFIFLKNLVGYCSQFNQGNWVTITPAILLVMENTAGQSLNVKDTVLFKKGYLVDKDGSFLLTHELVVTAFMCCSDGNFLPLSGGHIDFSGKEKLAALLTEHYQIKNNNLVNFLVSVALEFKDKKGTLLDAILPIGTVSNLAKEAGFIPPIVAIDLGYKYGMIAYNEEIDGKVMCNGLLWTFYLASPTSL